MPHTDKGNPTHRSVHALPSRAKSRRRRSTKARQKLRHQRPTQSADAALDSSIFERRLLHVVIMPSSDVMPLSMFSHIRRTESSSASPSVTA